MHVALYHGGKQPTASLPQELFSRLQLVLCNNLRQSHIQTMSHKTLPPIPRQPEFHPTQQLNRDCYEEAPPSYRVSVQNPSTLDIPQRLERKLAQYNASENVWKRWLFEIISWTASAACIVSSEP